MASAPPDPVAASPGIDAHDALPAGTRFGELEIVRVLGVGGFGIVYLAQDHALERSVALKEYMPSALAGRGKGQLVSIRSGAHTETYALGLRSFVNEARLLARFNHPSLVKVYRFWEENGTAYMVMPYLQGHTLRDVRRSMSDAPTEAWMRSVITPLLDALDQLHREDVFHRDIAPDNILLPPGELPVLLDFGAARRAIGDRTQTFTAILKPSYAPIEQYAEVVQLRQGAWTDLYALGAVVYYLLCGAPPPPATARAVQDDTPLLDPARHPGVSPQFVAAVEWALSVRPGDRPQSVAALREVLEGRAVVPVRARTGTTAPLVMPSVTGAQAPPPFVPTVALAKQAEEDDTIVPTQPLTKPPRTGSPLPDLPRDGEAAARPPRPQTLPAPLAEGRGGNHAQDPSSTRLPLLVAAFIAFVVLAAGAAWLIGSRTAKTAATVPPPAAVQPAPANAMAVPAAPVVAAASETAPAALKPPVVRLQRPVVRPAQRPASPSAAQPQVEGTAAGDSGAIPAPTVQMSAGTVARAGPATPREACGARVFMALALCMEAQCETPRFKAHPQCKEVLARLERRRRGEGGD
jgi:serine/threonine protein kinase